MCITLVNDNTNSLKAAISNMALCDVADISPRLGLTLPHETKPERITSSSSSKHASS